MFGALGEPKKWSFDWYGPRAEAPKPGSFLVSNTGRCWLLSSTREMKVKVSRGETVRLAVEVVPWSPKDVPQDAKRYEFWREPRRKKNPSPLL